MLTRIMGEGRMQIDMSLKKRLAYMFLGIFGMGIFLSFLLKVGYGTDTSSFMNSSVAAKFDISLGTTLVCTNALFLIPEIIWGRKLIGIGTIANMTLIGYTSDFCTYLEEKYLPDFIFTVQPYRTITFIVALAFFLVSVALYMNADLGQAPFDSISTMVSQHTQLSFTLVRMAWDFLMIIIGIIAGGKLTIGTVVLALTIGPSVSFIGRFIR